MSWGKLKVERGGGERKGRSIYEVVEAEEGPKEEVKEEVQEVVLKSEVKPAMQPNPQPTPIAPDPALSLGGY